MRLSNEGASFFLVHPYPSGMSVKLITQINRFPR